MNHLFFIFVLASHISRDTMLYRRNIACKFLHFFWSTVFIFSKINSTINQYRT